MNSERGHAVWICHLLNFLDAVFSLHFLQLGVKEANPILDFFYQQSPFSFLLVKFILFVSAIEYLNFILIERKERMVIFSMIMIIMSSVVAWHLWGFTII